MKNLAAKRALWVTCGFLLLLGLHLLLGNFDPTLDGKKLSRWIIDCQHGTPRDRIATMNAFEHFGASAVAPMLTWIQYQHPAWKEKAWNWSYKMPLSDSNCQRIRKWLNSDLELASATAEAFCLLGTNAVSAVDPLTRIASQSNGMPAHLASVALGEIRNNSARLKFIRTTLESQINEEK